MDEILYGFEFALTVLKAGGRVTRVGWNGKGQYVEKYNGREDGCLPYMQLRTVGGYRVPWLASQTDLLADDWAILDFGTKDPFANEDADGAPDVIGGEGGYNPDDEADSDPFDVLGSLKKALDSGEDFKPAEPTEA